MFIALDRIISIRIKNWSKSYFFKSRVTLFGLGLATFFLVLNIPLLIFNGYISIDANGTQHVVCYATSENDSSMIDTWHTVNYY